MKNLKGYISKNMVSDIKICKNRFLTLSEVGWGNPCNYSDMISFKTYQKLNMLGFGIYNTFTKKRNVVDEIEVSIHIDTFGNILHKENFVIDYDNLNFVDEIANLYFVKPVSIYKDYLYIISKSNLKSNSVLYFGQEKQTDTDPFVFMANSFKNKYQDATETSLDKGFFPYFIYQENDY